MIRAQTIRDWFTARMVEFRQAIQWGSVRLGVIASAVFTWLLASPEVLLATYNQMPGDLRGFMPPVFGVALFVLVYAVRVYKTKDLD